MLSKFLRRLKIFLTTISNIFLSSKHLNIMENELLMNKIFNVRKTWECLRN